MIDRFRAGGKCRHEQTQLCRIVCQNGPVHVMERCAACGSNVRGVAVWVPHRDLPCPVETLPLLKDLLPAKTEGEQLSLFAEADE